MNQTPKQPQISMIFTNADPRCTGRLDDRQGGDTIVTIERLIEALISMWSWRTSLSQHGCGTHRSKWAFP